MALVFALGENSMPRFSIAFCKRYAALASSWRSISRRHQIARRSFSSLRGSAAAASRPSRPPPMTTALPPFRAAASIASTLVKIAKRNDAGQLGAGNRNQNGSRASRNDERVVALDDAGLRADGLAADRWRRRFRLCANRHCAARTGVIVNDDVAKLLFAREHGDSMMRS